MQRLRVGAAAVDEEGGEKNDHNKVKPALMRHCGAVVSQKKCKTTLASFITFDLR